MQGKLGPHGGREGQRRRTRRRLGKYHKVPEDPSIFRGFVQSSFPSARGCRPGWREEGGWEMKGADAGTALPSKPHTVELPQLTVWTLKPHKNPLVPNKTYKSCYLTLTARHPSIQTQTQDVSAANQHPPREGSPGRELGWESEHKLSSGQGRLKMRGETFPMLGRVWPCCSH